MGTRSLIAIEDNSTESLVIYCHYDGYPSHQMPLLTKKYDTPARVRKLLSLGDLSCLETDKDWNQQPMKKQPLSYKMRGETSVDMVRRKTNELQRLAYERDAEWIYLFRGVHGWSYWKADWTCPGLMRGDGTRVEGFGGE